jgi:hypothetical protein
MKMTLKGKVRELLALGITDPSKAYQLIAAKWPKNKKLRYEQVQRYLRELPHKSPDQEGETI